VIISIEATCGDGLLHTGKERNVYRNVVAKQGEGKLSVLQTNLKLSFACKSKFVSLDKIKIYDRN
jgi:hypothetical protein